MIPAQAVLAIPAPVVLVIPAPVASHPAATRPVAIRPVAIRPVIPVQALLTAQLQIPAPVMKIGEIPKPLPKVL